MRKYILSALCLLPAFVYGQQTYTLKFLPQLQQSQWVNASNQSDAHVTVGLPVISGTSFYIFNSGFTYNDLFSRVNDSTVGIHPGTFIDKLKKKNVVNLGAEVSLLSASVAFDDLIVGFSVNDKVDFRFTYPKDLLGLAWYGNGAYIGKTVNIGDFGLKASWYREYALHGTKQFGRFTVGASPKLLFGKTNINTKSSNLSIHTAEDYYAITATTDLDVQTSGFSDSADKAQGTPSGSEYVFNTKNAGLGLDLGVSYQVNEKITVSGGINNLGYINWKSNIHNYKASSNSFTFDGFDLSNFIQGDSSAFSTDQYLDSVKNLVDFDKSTEAYKTSLPVEFFAMGNYKFNNKHALGAQLSAQGYNKKFIFSTTFCYQLTLGKHFTGALSYTMKTNSAFNIGGALIARFAGMQWYLSTDNWWASVAPLKSKNMNLNMGVNLVFGDRVKKKVALVRDENPVIIDRPTTERHISADEDADEDVESTEEDSSSE